MKETLERLRRLARAGLNSARTAYDRARASAIQAWTATPDKLREGWASFRDSWTKKDWMAGIEPLPPGMAPILAAIAMVTGLVVTSLVYGDHYQRQAWEHRLIPSGEHPSQQDDFPAPVEEPDAQPVPDPDTPEATPAPSAGSALPQQGEAFVERFDRDAIDDRWVVADGWSNGTWMANDWRRSSVGIQPNLLTLNLKKNPKGSEYELASGELQTHARHRYGYFEIRMKVPRASGLVTGFFTYAGRDGAQRPNEIDIEILGRNTRVVELTIHENNRPTSKKITLPFDAADDFHTYGFDWQPGHVRWYADGQLIHSETGGAAQRLVRPQQLFLNLWSSKELHAWVGRLDTNRAPWKLDVSCMAYAPTYTGALCN